jgi:acyl-CoA reductase-like NAD-dependent aldehyde dehydrogenase
MLPDAIPAVVSSFINGQWVDVAGHDELPVIFAASEQQISVVAEANEQEVGAAVDNARAVFESGAWSRIPVADRKRVLHRISQLILARQDELAALEVAHTGSPVAQAHSRHIPRAALNFEFFAEYIAQAANPVFDQSPDYLTYVRRDPAGVAALIAPWNAPLALASMKVAGAIAFGNSCVLKPSELTPLSFVPFMDILLEAGVPPGVVNMVNGRGPITGSALVAHPQTDVIAFTGGTATGRLIGAEAGKGIKKTVTELGGKSANIIFADADFERALDAALVAIFSNNGQQCLAGSRILVQRAIAERFTEAFVKRAKQLRLGDPYDKRTEIGALISAAQMERVLGYAEQARNTAGVEILTGGKRCERFDKGYFVEPTVVTASSNSLPVCQEEIFGPFATILSFDDEDEAYAIANDSEFGLVSYVWSQDISKVMRATEALQAGIVWVNTPLTRDLHAPFGGYKHSGVGRDGGDWSRSLFTEEKTVTIPTRDFSIAKLGVQPD